MGYVLTIFKFFLSALGSVKNYVNVTPSSLCIQTFRPYGITPLYRVIHADYGILKFASTRLAADKWARYFVRFPIRPNLPGTRPGSGACPGVPTILCRDQETQQNVP